MRVLLLNADMAVDAAKTSFESTHSPQTRCANALLPVNKTAHYSMERERPLIHLLQYAVLHWISVISRPVEFPRLSLLARSWRLPHRRDRASRERNPLGRIVCSTMYRSQSQSIPISWKYPSAAAQSARHDRGTMHLRFPSFAELDVLTYVRA